MITLTSDWNENDYYVASLKGKLLSACPEASESSTSTTGSKPSISAQAAFLVRNSYPHFPDNTIHIIAVNSEPEIDGQILGAKKDKQYFLCADNGILGLLGGKEPELVVRLRRKDPEHHPEVLYPCRCLRKLPVPCGKGKPSPNWVKPPKIMTGKLRSRATIEENTITGSVIHIDSYQNAITNISRELFERVGRGKTFTIYVQSKHYTIHRHQSTLQ
jgi:S-adenosylmethionine hydrolase